MKPAEHDEALWLAWIEDELDAEAVGELEARMQEDPELSERLHAMRRDRQALQSLVEPPVPAGLVSGIDSSPALKRTGTGGRPGQFRQGRQAFGQRARFKSNLRMAAMFIIGIGLLASLLIPVISSISGPGEDPAPVADSGDLLEFLAVRPSASNPGPENQAAASGESDVVLGEPEPLAVLLPSSDDPIAFLRRLAYRSGGTLVRNASTEDFKKPGLSASTGSNGTGGGTGSEALEPTFLQGRPEWEPSYDQQFEYAETGATWTIVVPLSRLDAFLGAFDDMQGDQLLLVLLSDHLGEEGGEWMRPARARATVANWPRLPREDLVHIPIYAGE